MRKVKRLSEATKKRLLLSAAEILGALDIKLSEAQQNATETAKTAKERHKELCRAYYYEHREELLAKKRAYRAEHLEEERARRRAYYEAHREKECARYAENREKSLAYQRAWRAAHHEEEKERKRIYREKHREEINAKAREAWRAKMQIRENREKFNAQKRKYYANMSEEAKAKRLEQKRVYGRTYRAEHIEEARARRRAYYEAHREEEIAKAMARKKERQNSELVGGQTSRSASYANDLSDQHRKICVTENAKEGITHENQRRNDGRGV